MACYCGLCSQTQRQPDSRLQGSSVNVGSNTMDTRNSTPLYVVLPARRLAGMPTSAALILIYPCVYEYSRSLGCSFSSPASSNGPDSPWQSAHAWSCLCRSLDAHDTRVFPEAGLTSPVFACSLAVFVTDSTPPPPPRAKPWAARFRSVSGVQTSFTRRLDQGMATKKTWPHLGRG